VDAQLFINVVGVPLNGVGGKIEVNAHLGSSSIF
jgi:hypothetical protein